MTTADPLALVLAYRTPNSVEARALAAYLEEAGLKIQFVGDFLSGAYAGLSMGRMGDKEVWVAAKDEATAAGLISEWQRENLVRTPDPPQSMTWARKAVWVAALLFLLLCGVVSVN